MLTPSAPSAAHLLWVSGVWCSGYWDVSMPLPSNHSSPASLGGPSSFLSPFVCSRDLSKHVTEAWPVVCQVPQPQWS